MEGGEIFFFFFEDQVKKKKKMAFRRAIAQGFTSLTVLGRS